MAKILWDESGKRIFETGISHGVLFVQGKDGKYAAGVPWNGLTGVTESPGGAEPTDLWADNIKYATLRSAETFGATIEAYTYPDEFMVCDGSAELAEGVFIGQQTRQTFGFSYKTQIGSDVDTSASAYKLHLIYNASASPSEKAYVTINDSPDAITFSWEVTTTPVTITGHAAVASITIDSTKAVKEKLEALEAMLYGSESSESKLPTPDEVAALFKTAQP